MVKLVQCSKKKFADQINNKRFVCYGAGKRFLRFMKSYMSEENIDNLLCIIDTYKTNQIVEYFGKSILIYNINQFIDRYQYEDFFLVITNISDYIEMVENLDQYAAFNNRDCFIEYIIDEEYPEQSIEIFTNDAPKIDKVIHYCWFGRSQIPDRLQVCIDSWKKFCPDYEIIRWDENNYNITKNRYMKDAYNAKKWGFVSDYARLDIVYHYGGFYLDTDVELIKSLNSLRGNDMYCGFESNYFVNFGLGFGAVKGHRIIKSIIDTYDNLEFNASHRTPVPSPVYQTEILVNEGVIMNNTFQRGEDFLVYPSEVMAPISPYMMGSGVTKNTISIHHFDASWVENRLERRRKLEKNKNIYFQRVKRIG